MGEAVGPISRSDGVAPRSPRGALRGLPVAYQLLLLSLLVGIGFVAVLTLATTELQETAIGGPLYATLREHTVLRRELAELRVGLADIMLVSTEAQLTSDPVLLRALQDRVAALNDDISQGFKQLETLSLQHTFHLALAEAQRTWVEFSNITTTSIRVLAGDSTAQSSAVLSLQPLRQAQFRRQIATLNETLEQADRELERGVSERVRVRARWFTIASVTLTLTTLALTAIIARSLTAP